MLTAFNRFQISIVALFLSQSPTSILPLPLQRLTMDKKKDKIWDDVQGSPSINEVTFILFSLVYEVLHSSSQARCATTPVVLGVTRL